MRTDRPRRLLAAAIAMAFGIAAPRPLPARDESPRPDIVFILVDDLRWDALGCLGHPFATTPNIDRLAAEGIVFRDAYVTTPVCSPSRASFLTGTYAHRHGVVDNADYDAISHELDTFPRRLKAAGYRTAYFGKWHMGEDGSPRPGFDRWAGFGGQGVHEDPLLNLDGEERVIEGYTADVLSDLAAAFIEDHAGDGPFCVYLSHKAVHTPTIPAGRHRDLFPDEPIPDRPGARSRPEGKPVLDHPETRLFPIDRGPRLDRLIRDQLRMMAAVDEGVGRILEALEKAGRPDQTLVIFTSDNGYFWGEHGLMDKHPAWEESVRIPLVMRYPRLIDPGTESEALVLNVDVAPTLLELAGAAIPGAVQGRSLVPLLRGIASDWRESILLEYVATPGRSRIPSWHAVRGPRWKYIHYLDEEGLDELYDLGRDPDELRNLIGDPSSAAALREMQTERERLIERLRRD